MRPDAAQGARGAQAAARAAAQINSRLAELQTTAARIQHDGARRQADALRGGVHKTKHVHKRRRGLTQAHLAALERGGAAARPVIADVLERLRAADERERALLAHIAERDRADAERAQRQVVTNEWHQRLLHQINQTLPVASALARTLNNRGVGGGAPPLAAAVAAPPAAADNIAWLLGNDAIGALRIHSHEPAPRNGARG